MKSENGHRALFIYVFTSVSYRHKGGVAASSPAGRVSNQRTRKQGLLPCYCDPAGRDCRLDSDDSSQFLKRPAFRFITLAVTTTALHSAGLPTVLRNSWTDLYFLANKIS